MAIRRSLARFAALAGAGALVAALVATPATAATPGAARSERAATHVIDRGRIIAAHIIVAKGTKLRTPTKPLLPAVGPKAAKVTLADFGAPATITPRIPLSPDPRIALSVPGIGRAADSLGLEPPDPWTAVNGTHVLSSTNSLLRIASRSGMTIASVPIHSLFALGDDEIDSDPRFLWDAAKGRWVGVVLSFSSGIPITFAYLNIAVSETADPTGAWRIYTYGYVDGSDNPTLPDYPGLATSGDKIVLTAQEYAADFGAFLGTSLLVVRWSDVLAGGPVNPILWTSADPTMDFIRPAVNQSTTNDVHLIGVNHSSTLYQYAKLSGSAPTAPAWTDIIGMSAAYCEANAPRQPDSPATITNAVDGRPTDAVFRSGQVAFVSTCFAGSSDSARLSVVDAATHTASYDNITSDHGGDAYMPGVGFAGDGTLFMTWTESSASPGDYPSAYVVARTGGSFYGMSQPLQRGDAAYGGTRWGDYVGVAQDPTATGAVWMTVETPDGLGYWRTHIARIVSDAVQPAVTKAPTQALITGSQLGSFTVPIKLSFAATDAGSGVKSISLALNRSGTGFIDAGSATGTSATRNAWWKASGDPTSYTHQWAAQATDWAGNPSPAVAGSSLTPVVYQQSLAQFTYSSGWRSTSSTSYSGSSAKYASTAGASVTFKTSGRSFGFVTTRGSTRGKVKVYVDGTLKGTVTLTSSTTAYRRLMYTITFGSSATHSIKLVVASGRVDVDGFVVLK